MTDNRISREDQEIQRFLAERGVSRCPAAVPRGLGASRWQPNLGRAGVPGGQLDAGAVDARRPGDSGPTRRRS